MSAVQFLAEAEEELQLAIRSYEERRKGLGREFLAEVRASLDLIHRHPRMVRSMGAGLRKAGVRRFPYDIVYRIRLDAVEVIAVMHHRRAPGYWTERL